MASKIIETIQIEGLLTKLNGTFVGGLCDDKSTISLIRYDNYKFNVSIEHPSFNFGNGKKVYIFSSLMCENPAREAYNMFRRMQNG